MLSRSADSLPSSHFLKLLLAQLRSRYDRSIESVQLVGKLLCIFGVDTLSDWFASGHRLLVFPELQILFQSGSRARAQLVRERSSTEVLARRATVN